MVRIGTAVFAHCDSAKYARAGRPPDQLIHIAGSSGIVLKAAIKKIEGIDQGPGRCLE